MESGAHDRRNQRAGSVLVTALIMILIGVIGAASAARYCLHERRLSRHSAARAQALHAAEAGAEAAMYAFHRQLRFGDGWSGWTLNPAGLYATGRPLPGTPTLPGSYEATANTGSLTIISSGSVTATRLPGPVVRTVQVVLEMQDIPFRSPFEWGMLARNQLDIQGNPLCLSYHSGNGPFGGTNVAHHCNIGATGLRLDAIRGGGAAQVFGDAAIIPGADVVANPAPFWTGILHRDLEADFPDVVVPRTDMTMPAINASTTIHVSGETYAGTPGISLSGPRTLTIRGSGVLTLYVNGDLDVGTPSSITYAPDAGGSLRVRMFLDGDADIKGDLNTGGLPENLQIYGTTNCTSIDCQANNNKSLAIYAPQARIDLSGTAIIQGAVVGDNIRLRGNFNFRYDEALANLTMPVDPELPQEYVVRSWMEL